MSVSTHLQITKPVFKKHYKQLKENSVICRCSEKRTNKLISSCEEDRLPVTECNAVFGKTFQLADSINKPENDLKRLEDETTRLEAEDQDLNQRAIRQLRKLLLTLNQMSKIIKEIRLAQGEEMEFHKYLSDLFSHVIRTIAKLTR